MKKDSCKSENLIANALQKMKDNDFKITKQRKVIIEALFSKGHRHITVEEFHKELLQQGIKLSVATIYNTLNSLYKINVINEIKTSTSSFFDTCTETHAHILYEDTNKLEDIEVNSSLINQVKENYKDIERLKNIEVIFKVNSN